LVLFFAISVNLILRQNSFFVMILKLLILMLQLHSLIFTCENLLSISNGFEWMLRMIYATVKAE